LDWVRNRYDAGAAALGQAWRGLFIYDRASTSLEFNEIVRMELSSPAIQFTEPVTKKLNVDLNTVSFVGMPNDSCHPGTQTVLLSITDPKSGFEHISQTAIVEVVDYAFDHISRPRFAAVVSALSAVGTLVAWGLSVLGQIDQTWGIPAGGAAAALAAFLAIRYQWLYRSMRTTGP
jgi:hypothetical protein